MKTKTYTLIFLSVVFNLFFTQGLWALISNCLYVEVLDDTSFELSNYSDLFLPVFRFELSNYNDLSLPVSQGGGPLLNLSVERIDSNNNLVYRISLNCYCKRKLTEWLFKKFNFPLSNRVSRLTQHETPFYNETLRMMKEIEMINSNIVLLHGTIIIRGPQRIITPLEEYIEEEREKRLLLKFFSFPLYCEDIFKEGDLSFIRSYFEDFPPRNLIDRVHIRNETDNCLSLFFESRGEVIENELYWEKVDLTFVKEEVTDTTIGLFVILNIKRSATISNERPEEDNFHQVKVEEEILYLDKIIEELNYYARTY